MRARRGPERITAMLRFLLATLAGALLLASPAAQAQTAPYYEVEYEVALTVTADWAISQADVDDYPKRTFQGNAKTTFTAKVGDVLFRNGRLLSLMPMGPVTVPTTSGGGTTVTKTWDASEQRELTTNGTCTAMTAPYNGYAKIEREAEQAEDTEETLNMRLVDALPTSFDCTYGDSPAADLAYNGNPFPDAVFDAQFSLPHEAIGMGKIIQNIYASPANRSPQFCPAKDVHTTSCEFNWTGQLTFTKVAEWQYGIETPGQQPPSPPFDPRADAISRAVEQYGKEPFDPRADAISKAVEQYGKETMDPRAQIISDAVAQYGREIQFKAGCTAGCTGTAVITPAAGPTPKAYAAARKALAKLRFKVAAGKPRIIRLKLTPKARAALRRARNAKVHITLKPRSGPTRKVTLALRKKR